MGLNLDELGNPQAWAKAHAEELAKATATEAELQKDKAGQIIARRAQAAQKLCDIDIKEVKKHVKRGSMIFFAISGLAIGSMLLQGPLSAGVAMQQSGEEDR